MCKVRYVECLKIIFPSSLDIGGFTHSKPHTLCDIRPSFALTWNASQPLAASSWSDSQPSWVNMERNF